MNFESSSVMITGASRGIGKTIALAFARETKRPLILLSRDKNKLKETRDTCHGVGAQNVTMLICDASVEAEVNSLTLPEGYPPPGILINNAGNFLLKPLEQTTGKELQDQLNANLLTAFNVTKRFLPVLKKYDRAVIANICSTASIRGFADSGAYTASKHALLGYTRSLRKELSDNNIAVTAINLGQTESSSWEGSNIDPDLLIDPEDIAALLLTLTNLTSRTVVEEITIRPRGGRVAPF